jgi:mannose-1-phosphate guanylyltransferase/mannose-6-phosphate isomerase
VRLALPALAGVLKHPLMELGMETLEICPVILAGGSGTRLWPLSRAGYPKQLLRLKGNHSLLQDTVIRLDGLAGKALGSAEEPTQLSIADPMVVCSEELRFLIIDQLEGIGRGPCRILLEPVSRNTAPALTIAALTANRHARDPILVVMPADHVIEDIPQFHKSVLAGINLARDDTIVTFGVAPSSAESGYGYIRRRERIAEMDSRGGFWIDAFVEKPDQMTAESYLASGDYYWNSGLFMMKASTWLKAMSYYQPLILEACEKAWDRGREDEKFYRVDRSAFEACTSDSIDYAVMERLTESYFGKQTDAGEKPAIAAAVVPLDAGWSDVGAWPAIMQLGTPDSNGNVLVGDVYGHEIHNSLLFAENRLIAALGLDDIIAVATADAVLIAHKSHSQDVKRIVNWLKEAGRNEGNAHRRVYRPWGYYEGLDTGDRFQVKRLSVKPGAALSVQMHHHRAEHWIVVRGTAKVTRDDEVFLLTENQSTYIPIGTKHRLENPGKLALELIEVQSGSYLGEDDILRFEDRYHRGAED